MNKLIQFWGDLRSSFWFLPFLIVMSSIVYAVALIRIDYAGSDRWLGEWPRIFGVGAEGARDMLSTLAGSMMTVMGITSSMTLLALTLASSQYTSRVLRNFMRSRVTQVTLGTFAGIFVYCLIVLYTIRTGDAPFVPSLAVFFAFILAFGGIAVLIFFIHHIASSIQASSIIASVALETYAAIDRLLPKKMEQSDQNEVCNQGLESLDEREWYPVPAAQSGYIQNVNNDALFRLSMDSRTVVRMEQGIGAFVVQNTALLSLALTYPPDNKTIAAFNAAYSIGRHRTVEQDLAFGIRQIVDIAIKALSPGLNDTSTAVICVDYLGSIMAQLSSRQFPPSNRYEGETLRVMAIVLSFEELLAEAFDQIRANAEVNVAILVRTLGALDNIGRLTNRLSYLRALEGQRQCIAEVVYRRIESSIDRERLERHLAEVRETLETQSAWCEGEEALWKRNSN
ncbi:MAG: DUF2254 domain-containing protein [Psychromonas sp.]